MSPKSEEVEKVLRQAHVHKMRGEKARAMELLTRATELAPEDPDTWEAMGDMLMDLARYEEAQTAFGRALELQPGRVSADKKFARAVFFHKEKRYERERLERLMSDPTAGEVSLVPRKPGLALMMGLVLPSSAQFYNGQFVKGGIILGVLSILFVFMLANPGFVAAAKGFLRLLATAPEPGTAQDLSFWVVFAGFLWLIVYLYSVLDGVIVAARLGAAYRPPPPPPPLSDLGPKK